MADSPRFYQTTAIDYPNSRPHIGTAFEKIGADVQARYRRMEGYEVHFLMGNDENTIKVAKKAAELGRSPKEYCDDMARQFQEVWREPGIGYATDDEKFRTWWPADMHFIGKDITRFHCALWPAMLMAAGLEPPKMVFAHGFVYRKNEDTGVLEKFSKTLGNVIEPMDIITRFSAEAFRYYFLRECPFPGDGEFSWQRFGDLYNADLANNLGNLYSRVVRLIVQNYDGRLEATAGLEPGVIYT